MQPHLGLISRFSCHAPLMAGWVCCLTLPTMLTSTSSLPRSWRETRLYSHSHGYRWVLWSIFKFWPGRSLPCKVHAVPGKHHSSERDCTVGIHQQPRHGEAQALSWGQNMPGGTNPVPPSKAQGSENRRSYPKGKALAALRKVH